MLRFTEQPYEFKESKPNRLVYRLATWVNRTLILPGSKHRIRSMQVHGGNSLKQLSRDRNVRLIFVANHSTHSDVEVLVEAQRRCGIWGGFMAAHEVFSRSRFQSWVMQRVGAFSVNRENVDRQSIKEAVKVVKDSRCCLSLFPEGNVAFSNEQIAPFMDGAAFMALKAQKSLGDDARVLVIPCSIRLTHTSDVSQGLKAQLQYLVDCLQEEGIVVKLNQTDPFFQQIETLGYAILKRGVERRGLKFSDDQEIWNLSPEATLQEVISTLLSRLEELLQTEAKGGVEERIRAIRSRLAQLRLEDGMDLDVLAHWDDLSVLLMRVRSYDVSYLRSCPSIDRCSETLEKLREDYSEELVRPEYRRHAEVIFGNPIEVKGKKVTALTRECELAVGVGLSQYSSVYPGGGMME